MAQTSLSLIMPDEIAQALAERCRALRLLRNWKRTTLAERAGITVASLRRFETTGKASLELVLKVAFTLGRLDEFNQLFQAPSATSLAELETRSTVQLRKRGIR